MSAGSLPQKQGGFKEVGVRQLTLPLLSPKRTLNEHLHITFIIQEIKTAWL